MPKDIYNKRLDKTDELTKKIDYNDLNLIVNSTNSETNFSGVKDPITLLNDIKEKKITIKQAKTSSENFNNHLKMIQRGKNTEEQKKTLANINMLFNGRTDSIKFVEDYDSMIVEAKRKSSN